MKPFSGFAAAAGTALALAACGGASESDREAQMEEIARDYGVDADVELGSDGTAEKVTIDGPMGAKFGKNVDLPADFPDDVVVDGGWNVISVSPMPGGGSTMQAMTGDTVEAITGKLDEGMSGNGWSHVRTETPTPQMTRVVFEKGGRMANYTILATDPQRTVQFLTMDKPG